MKRWKKVLIWTLSVIVVLGVGGLFAANYAVDKLMNSMADGFDVEADDTSNVPQGQVVEPAVASGNAETEPSVTNSPEATGAPEDNESKDAKNQQPASNTSKPTTPPDASKNTDSKDGYTAQVSTDKAKEIQESVTVKDKANVAAIVAGQLSVADIKRLQELAKGGLTIEEKREARSIILGKVSEEQYNELSQVAKKYGVSQGKTRDQVIAEEEQSKAQEKGSE